MKFPTYLPCVAAGIALLASCYPVPDTPRQQQRQAPDQTVTPAQQQRSIEEQRERMREQAERREREQREQQASQEQASETTETTAQRETPETPDTPEPVRREDYDFATPVPGKEGFVFSPYNNKVVDVRDIPSGTLVQDPTFPPSEKKYFRVP